MNKQWQAYCNKYLAITPREQVLILLTGLVLIILFTFHFFIDSKMIANKNFSQGVSQLTANNRTLALSINEYNQALKQDPNTAARAQLAGFESQLGKIDTQLLALTSELINPVQMRFALVELLNVAPDVELISFELTGVEPILSADNSSLTSNSQVGEKSTVASATKQASEDAALASNELNLYQHGIKIKLAGSYFALQRYLQQLEQLSWKFFWQEFDFKVKEYPVNELTIEIYSLGAKKEFVGV